VATKKKKKDSLDKTQEYGGFVVIKSPSPDVTWYESKPDPTTYKNQGQVLIEIKTVFSLE
jgi:hypothetical protein